MVGVVRLLRVPVLRVAALLLLFAAAASAQFVSNSSSANATSFCSDAYTFTSAAMGRNIQAAMAQVLDRAPAAQGFASTSVGALSDAVYALAQCRGDLAAADCSSCARSAAQILNSTCVRNSTRGGRVYLPDCFLRYEDHFFAASLDTVSSLANCSSSSEASASPLFLANARAVTEFLEARVPAGARKFGIAVAGIGSPAPAYALAQCIPDLSAADCATCLSDARNVIDSTCRSGAGGACYYASCTLYFQGSIFFQGVPENATLSSTSNGKKTVALAVGVSIAGVAALLLLVAGFCIFKRRKRSRESTSKQGQVGDLDELQLTLHRGPVTFSYELLRRATDDFSDANKLGEGGFGAVYKGRFGDGTEIAIKKLSVTSKQGEQQFLNEVKVIGSVQHRNLVKLLGCCVEGAERLLVYEFLKNNSLEKVLLDDSRSGEEAPRLSFETRYNILLGTARGLTYLHEDSQVRIVHRDIKPSNILLDEAFEAKISDFGLARLYGEDEATEIVTTKVAGTYGYMAPEYAIHGHLSEKADVFSYGVVVLETMAGRKNRDLTLPGPEQYLLEWAWELHSERSLSRLLDPKLVNSISKDQEQLLEQAIHIALMCTQASPQDRPNMSHVVAMFSGHSNVHVPLTATFDIGILRPKVSSQATSSSGSASDSKSKSKRQQRQDLSKTFTEPEPR